MRNQIEIEIEKQHKSDVENPFSPHSMFMSAKPLHSSKGLVGFQH